MQVQGVWYLREPPLSTRPKAGVEKLENFARGVDYLIGVVFLKTQNFGGVLIIPSIFLFDSVEYVHMFSDF